MYIKEIDKYQSPRIYIPGKTSWCYHIKQYYDSKHTQLYCKYTIIDSKKSGEETFYHKNGNLHYTNEWINGEIKKCKWISYYNDNKQLEKQLYYESDNNYYTLFLHNNNIIKKQHHIDGKLVCDIRYIFYPNKALHKIIFVKSTKKANNWLNYSLDEDSFFPTSTMITDGSIDNLETNYQGKWTAKWYNQETKKIQFIESYIGSKRYGDQYEYYPNGSLKTLYYMEDSKFEGLYIKCNEDTGYVEDIKVYEKNKRVDQALAK